MTAVLLDTHSWAYAIIQPNDLPVRAREAINAAETVYLSPISLFEVTQKVRLGEWAAMEPVVADLWNILVQQNVQLAAFDAATLVAAGLDSWSHRDPFDRIIVATARIMDIAIVTKDRAMTTAPGIRTIW